MFFSSNPCQGRFRITKIFVDSISPPSYELHPEDPLKVNGVPFDCSVAGLTIMVFSFLWKMKRKIMVAEAFVLFLSVTIGINGGI